MVQKMSLTTASTTSSNLRSGAAHNRGFTIIEVLIVLAIAGLILLIVFLAVPALQRNARNTTKRSDASKAYGAVGEFIANKNGAIPTTSDLASLTSMANLSNGTTLTSTIANSVASVVAPTTSEIEIGTGLVCNATSTWTTAASPTAAQWQAIVSAGSARAVVALYSVEAAGGQVTTQCR
jgi:prepilin-type N-terminal cleavage/methylation domain-containing protein